jgi:predicted PurR-regulated permease PerM
MNDHPHLEESLVASDRRPNVKELAAFLQGPLDVRSVSLSVLLILALGATLYIARAVLMPIVLAILLSFLLAPVVKGLARLCLPGPLGAAVVLLAILGLAGLGVYGLWEPATQWIQQLPKSVAQIEAKMRPVRQSVEDFNEATKKVENMAQVGKGEVDSTFKVEMQRPSLTGTMLNQTLNLVATVGAITILLYFLLASGDLFLQKLVRVLPRLSDKKIAVTIVHEVEHDISRYLLTITLINAGLGGAVGITMFWLGMPNPLLWGVMAASFNFIPYLGAITSAVILTLVALLTFDDVARALAVPGVFMGLTALEGFLITPTIVGRRLTLNPVAIFIWLTFWGWLWGVPGMLLAVPLLATLKIVCDHIQPLNPVGEFLGD